jgi:hypothetical protein
LLQLDAIRKRALHQQRIDAVGNDAKTLGTEITRPLLVACEEAWRLPMLPAGFDQTIDSRMEFRVELAQMPMKFVRS